MVFSTPIDETSLSVFAACGAFISHNRPPPPSPSPPLLPPRIELLLPLPPTSFACRFTGRPLLSYIGDQSFIAVGSPDWAAKARLFPGVVTASPRSAHAKVSPEMREHIRARTSAAVGEQSDAASAVQVRSLALCYGAVGCRHARAAIAHLSCTTYLHAEVLEFHCPLRVAEAAAAAAASSAGVYWIEPKAVITSRNWSGKSIIGTGSSQTFAAGQPNPSKVFSTVSLQNSVIAASDSGLSRNNCYFCTKTGD